MAMAGEAMGKSALGEMETVAEATAMAGPMAEGRALAEASGVPEAPEVPVTAAD